MRTVTLAARSEAAWHSAVGLQWGAQSDDEGDFGAPAMDGYTSSSDSYGGHMGGFAFEGAVSEADPYEADYARYAGPHTWKITLLIGNVECFCVCQAFGAALTARVQ